VDRAKERTSKWTEDEDNKVEGCGTKPGGNDWAAISALVPGRTKIQCWSRWDNTLNLSIGLTARREGKWTEDEDIKLKDAVRRTVTRIGLQLPRWFRVEPKISVIRDGMMSWIPASTERIDVRVNGQKTKT
jgi:hypothetical protein